MSATTNALLLLSHSDYHPSEGRVDLGGWLHREVVRVYLPTDSHPFQYYLPIWTCHRVIETTALPLSHATELAV